MRFLLRNRPKRNCESRSPPKVVPLFIAPTYMEMRKSFIKLRLRIFFFTSRNFVNCSPMTVEIDPAVANDTIDRTDAGVSRHHGAELIEKLA